MKHFMAGLILVSSLSIAQANDRLVSLDDILLLSQGGLSDQTILVFLKNREVDFIPDADDIDSLLEAGVSDEVIRYLLELTPNKTRYIDIPVTYVARYPAYYYTPYYTRTSLFFGFSAFPHTFSGYYPLGSVPHAQPLRLGHNGYGVSRGLHGNKHRVIHTGGRLQGHKSFVAGHNSPRAGHALTGIRHGKASSNVHNLPNNRHDKTASASHNSRSIGHAKTTAIAHYNGKGKHGLSGISQHSRSSGVGHKGGFSNGHRRSSGGGHSSAGSSAHGRGH